MKKIFLLLLIAVSSYANAQFIYPYKQLRFGRVGGIYRLQLDSSNTGNWRTLATENYVRGYVSEHGGGGGTIDSLSSIGYRPFSALQSIPTTIAGYGISDAVNSSRNLSALWGLTGGGNLTADRSFKVDSQYVATLWYLRFLRDSLVDLISSSGGGTVLSVSRTNGYGISASVSDPSANPNITIAIDSSALFATALRRKDSVAGGYYPYSSNPLGYLVSGDLSGYVPTTRTVNGKLLSSNITLILASSDFANQGTTTTVLHGNASGSPSFSQIVNADVSSSAAIAYSKLALTGSIVNADVSASAAIAYSKLNLTGSILNGDITNGTIDLTAKVTNSLPVANGGTGKSSLTAYAILAGGTTSTGAMQQVSGVGTSGQVLTSNGAGALPTWQAAPGTQNFYYQNMVNADSSFVLRNDSTLLGKAYVVTANSNRIRQVAHTYSGDSIVYQPIDVNVANLATGTPSSSTYLRGDSTWAVISSSGLNNTISVYQALGSAIDAASVGVDYQAEGSFNTYQLTDGRVHYIAIYLSSSATLNGVGFYQRTQGNYTADNTNQVGLFTYSGGTMTQVAASANNGNLWKATANTWVKEPFATPYSASAGLYFIGFVWNASVTTTAPVISAGRADNQTNEMTMDFTNSATISGRKTGTALPSSQTMAGLDAASPERPYVFVY